MKTVNKVTTLGVGILTVALAVPTLVSAHVAVSPKSVTVGTEQLFSVSVPNEKEVDVTSVRLEIPAGIEDATPTVHPGWTIETKHDKAKQVTEITWSGGSIPSGQRDDFTFNAQAPAKAGEADWKAYQTYADGSVVGWDQKPVANASDDASGSTGPYSVTKIADDTATAKDSQSSKAKASSLPLILSLIALVLSVASLTHRRSTAKK